MTAKDSDSAELPSWYAEPEHPVADEYEAINALRTTYADRPRRDGREGTVPGGWLSTLIFNTRGRYVGGTPIDAWAVRMIVEGFLSEVERLRAERDAAVKAFELEIERWRLAKESSCRADRGEPCSCANGIGCIHVPYSQW